MRKSFKFKLYRNKRKNRKLQRKIEIASEIWNYCVERQKAAYENKEPYINKYQLQKDIVYIKNTYPDYQHWNTLNSQTVQEITDRVDKAYQRFFKWAKSKSGPRMLPPKFKSRKKYKSITYKTSGWKYDGNNEIIIQGVKYRFHNSREILGNIKTVTIKRDSVGDYWVVFSCDNVEEPYQTQMTGSAVGADFGLKTFITLSDATEIIAPEPFKQNLKELARKNRNLSKKVKGGNNRNRAGLEVARLHRKISNQRKDFHWKLAHYLVSNYDIISFETLNLEGMKRLWGRKISDLSFAEFINILEYKANKEDKQIVFVDRWFPSTKTCFDCGFINKSIELKDRNWYCPECGVYHDRDLNAAMNILKESERAFSDRLENIRPLFGGDSWLTLESHML